MKSRLFSLLAASMVTASLVMSGGPASALNRTSAASGSDVSDDWIQVCGEQALKATDDLGRPLPDGTLRLHLQTIQRMCDDEKMDAAAPANVGAIIGYTPASGVMLVRAIANSLPRATYALSCLYRYEPVSGNAGAWQDCGVVRDTNTYLATRGNEWCPVPGTRWRVNAALYNSSDRLIGTDDAWKVAS